MKIVASIVSTNDGDILPYSVYQIARQVDSVVVFLNDRYWKGYRTEIDNVDDIMESIRVVKKQNGFENVFVCQGSWDIQEDHRNDCLYYSVNNKLIEEGDLHVQVDADELWDDNEIALIIDYFRENKDAIAMSGSSIDFWKSRDYMTCDPDKTKDDYYHAHRPRFHRYFKGSYFGWINDWKFANGDWYPKEKNGLILRTKNIFGRHVWYYHYEWTRPLKRIKEKAEAFANRRKDLRKDWFKDVYVKWSADDRSIEDINEGVSLVKNKKKIVEIFEGKHPKVMESYPYFI